MQDRLIIIEHPFRQEFTLKTPEKPSERARDVYRFEVKVPAGKSAKQDVVEERDLLEQISLSNADDQSIRIFLKSQLSSAKVKEAIQKASELKGKLASTQRELAGLNQQLQDITQDQARLRANLKEMPQSAAAYKRYLDKFDKQETEIEKLQADIKKLQEAELRQRQELDNYLANLTIE